MAFHQEKRIAIGMVGGGPGSGIGETHRIAMRIDNKCELIAGAFSRSREKSLAVAKELSIHVICDKPLCVSLSEAKELLSLADKSSLIVCLTHNYTGYAMVRQAAKMVRNGELGEIKAVHVEHASGWASKLQPDEQRGQPSCRM